MRDRGSSRAGACHSAVHLARQRRSGKLLVMCAVLLPILVGIAGMVVDTGMLLVSHDSAQDVAAAAATAAALDRLRGGSDQQAVATARAYVHRYNGVADAHVRVHIPPQEGDYAGNEDYVEVAIRRPVRTHLVQVLGGAAERTISSRAVAGFEATTEKAAIMVLGEQPRGRAAGLDIIGYGTVHVDGSVLVNTAWGAVDEHSNPAGSGPLAPYGIRCRGTSLAATDVRVAGGVDDPRYYRHSSLKANRLPVPDPLQELEDPASQDGGWHGRKPPSDAPPATNSAGVAHQQGWRGGSKKHRVLQPGTYEWIENTEADITFRPGIYVLRGVHPRTGLTLNLQRGTVTGEGVMFYIAKPAASLTDGRAEDVDHNGISTFFDQDPRAARTSFMDAMQAPIIGPLRQFSVRINLDSNSRLSPLDNAASPFDGILLYQARQDDRTTVIRKSARAMLAGCIYARQGHVLLDVRGICRASFVTGSMRIVSRGSCLFRPVKHLPPAEDVFLVE